MEEQRKEKLAELLKTTAGGKSQIDFNLFYVLEIYFRHI